MTIRRNQLLRNLVLSTLLVMALSLISFHEISKDSEATGRIPASQTFQHQ